MQGVSIKDIQQTSARSGSLDHEVCVFVSEDYENELSDQNLFVLGETGKQPQQMELPGLQHEYIRKLYHAKNLFAVNTSLFRTPQDMVIVSHEPEREFLFRLIERSRFITSWIKSPNSGFYSLDYEFWKGGKDRVRRAFNPDFFISLVIRDYLLLNKKAISAAVSRLRHMQEKGVEEIIMVVEIKADDDDSEATRAKEQYGRDHFKTLNSRLRDENPINFPDKFRSSVSQQRYIFHILRPTEYGKMVQ